MWILLALLCSLFISVESVFSKISLRSVDEYFTSWALHVVASVILLCSLPFFGIPQVGAEFYPALIVGTLGNAVATICFMRAIRLSDLSLAVPLTTLSPLFLLISAPLILGEFPNPSGVLGVCLIVVGAYTLNIQRFHEGWKEPMYAVLRNKGARYMLVTTLLWGVLAPIDKIGIRNSSPVFWITIFTITLAVIFTPLALWWSHEKTLRAIHEHRLTFVAMGSASAIGLACQMFAVNIAPVAYVISIKRLSVLWGVIFGAVIFKEQGIKSRLTGACIMVAGAVLIALSK